MSKFTQILNALCTTAVKSANEQTHQKTDESSKILMTCASQAADLALKLIKWTERSCNVHVYFLYK